MFFILCFHANNYKFMSKYQCFMEYNLIKHHKRGVFVHLFTPDLHCLTESPRIPPLIHVLLWHRIACRGSDVVNEALWNHWSHVTSDKTNRASTPLTNTLELQAICYSSLAGYEDNQPKATAAIFDARFILTFILQNCFIWRTSSYLHTRWAELLSNSESVLFTRHQLHRPQLWFLCRDCLKFCLRHFLFWWFRRCKKKCSCLKKKKNHGCYPS